MPLRPMELGRCLIKTVPLGRENFHYSVERDLRYPLITSFLFLQLLPTRFNLVRLSFATPEDHLLAVASMY